MVNSQKLKDKMKEQELSETAVAVKMGLAQSTLNQKINNRRPFKLDEARMLQKILHITKDDFSRYFFR